MSMTIDGAKDILISALRTESMKFIKTNASDVSLLGENVVKAILKDELKTSLPVIPALETTASLEEIVLREEIHQERSEVFQLIAKAEKENAEAVQRVRNSAITTVAKIVGIAVQVVTGIAMKAI